MAHVGKEHRYQFEIVRELKHLGNDKVRWFVLETEHGPRTIRCPKKTTSVYKYGQCGKTHWEAWLPYTFCRANDLL